MQHNHNHPAELSLSASLMLIALAIGHGPTFNRLLCFRSYRRKATNNMALYISVLEKEILIWEATLSVAAYLREAIMEMLR